MRREIECVGGPRCGDTFFLPDEGDAIQIPADASVPLETARLLAPLVLPKMYRVGTYQVALDARGDLVFIWRGEEG